MSEPTQTNAVGKLGVLLVNLGSPEAPTYAAVRKYLREFLSDRRVIQLNPLLWQPILNLFILNFRPLKTARLYKEIWNKKANESPLIHFTRQQSDKLQRRIGQSGNNSVVVDWAMRYGAEAIPDKLTSLEKAQCDKIFVLPLYPQFSHTTTSSIRDKVEEYRAASPTGPTIKMLECYCKYQPYIDALASSIKTHLTNADPKPEKLVVTFHGIPQSYHEQGDPYAERCRETFQLLKQKLSFAEEDILMTFQSRFGPSKWVEPYTDETVVRLAQNGTKHIAMVAPGFASDCIETLEELDIQVKEEFIGNGGETFFRIPCLNDSQEAISLYASIVAANVDISAECMCKTGCVSEA